MAGDWLRPDAWINAASETVPHLRASSIARAAPAGTIGRTAWDRMKPGLLLLGVALLARCALFGNPVIEGDEQFYLLVGDRFLKGALPYVDLWDRKPIGLFLLYAGIRLLGGEGILQYQLVATLFAAATALLIARIAAEVGARRGAVLAGVMYLLWLNLFGGGGGQSPVFYNLFMAGAALLTLRAAAHPASGIRLLGFGTGAMLVAGLAMQIKYTALFEGAFLGCALLWRGWRSGLCLPRLLGYALVWVGAALLPTAAALAAYALLGEATAFIFTNFTSFFHRSTAAGGSALGRLAVMAALLSPLALCAGLGLRAARGALPVAAPGTLRADRFLAAWLGVAAAGVLLLGTYYNHYALPLLVPLCAAAAPLLGDPRRRLATVGLVLFAVLAGGAMVVAHGRSRGNGEEIRALAAEMRLGSGETLYVFDGDPVLYHLADSPLPTRFAFPTHLNDLRETAGIGTDPLAELHRILAARPTFIVTTDMPRPRNNPAAWRMAEEVLRADYRLVRSVAAGDRARLLYRRVDRSGSLASGE